MENKIILLKIIRDNQTLGIHKIDRLFYDVVDFSTSWVTIMKELRQEELIEDAGYKITKKGLEYLVKNSK